MKRGIRPALLYPPRFVKILDRWLRERFPDAEQDAFGGMAEQIDGLIRDMLRAQRSVKMMKPRSNVAAFPLVLKKSPSVVDALRRIKSFIEVEKLHLYCKAIAEAPADAIALIECVKGDQGWPLDKTVIGATGLPIPAPSALSPFLQTAIDLASTPGGWSKWRRDRAVRELAIFFTKLTAGTAPKQLSKHGSFASFLTEVEEFYNARLPDDFKLNFSVQKSRRAMLTLGRV